jgi:molybdopterin synthase catalytic subunit
MFAISRDPIDPKAIADSVRSSRYGGVVTFLGVVRDCSSDGRAVKGLSYEAHEAMALHEFAKIADEVRASHGDVALAIAHRTGDLSVGEVAVCVCAAAPHRAAAFASAQYAIDELKRRAPIWKREGYTDGTGDWISNEC